MPLGFNIQNAGQITVAEGAQLYFAPNADKKSINTIKGVIDVKGTISGTLQKNFENQGIINNYGTVSNLINTQKGGANSGLRPGQVNIMNLTAVTTVNVNEGIINYGSNLTADSKNGITLLNDAAAGTVTYEGEGLALKVLNAAEVTEATITSGTLTVPYTAGKATTANLTKLVVENAAVSTDTKDKTAALTLAGSVTLKGETTVTDVEFYSLEKQNIGTIRGEYAVLVEGGVVTFDGTVGFYTSDFGAEYEAITEANVWFNAADVVNKGTLTANALKSVGDKSDIDNNAGTINLSTATAYDNQITIHGAKPVAIDNGTRPVDPTPTDEPYTFASGGTLKELAEALKTTAYTDIVLNCGLDMSKDDNKNYISALKGKNLTIGGTTGCIFNITTAIEVESLTLTSTKETVIGGVANVVAINTKKVTVNGVSKNNVVGRVQMAETAVLNEGSLNVTVTNIPEGQTARYITANTADGTILNWSWSTKRWVNID